MGEGYVKYSLLIVAVGVVFGMLGGEARSEATYLDAEKKLVPIIKDLASIARKTMAVNKKDQVNLTQPEHKLIIAMHARNMNNDALAIRFMLSSLINFAHAYDMTSGSVRESIRKKNLAAMKAAHCILGKFVSNYRSLHQVMGPASKKMNDRFVFSLMKARLAMGFPEGKNSCS
jgi:hypothetical protein